MLPAKWSKCERNLNLEIHVLFAVQLEGTRELFWKGAFRKGIFIEFARKTREIKTFGFAWP